MGATKLVGATCLNTFPAQKRVKKREKTVVLESGNRLEETPVGTRGDPRGPAPHSRIVFKRHVIRLQKSGPVKKSIFFVKFVKLIFSPISSRKRRITLEIALVYKPTYTRRFSVR